MEIFCARKNIVKRIRPRVNVVLTFLALEEYNPSKMSIRTVFTRAKPAATNIQGVIGIASGSLLVFACLIYFNPNLFQNPVLGFEIW